MQRFHVLCNANDGTHAYSAPICPHTHYVQSPVADDTTLYRAYYLSLNSGGDTLDVTSLPPLNAAHSSAAWEGDQLQSAWGCPPSNIAHAQGNDGVINYHPLPSLETNSTMIQHASQAGPIHREDQGSLDLSTAHVAQVNYGTHLTKNFAPSGPLWCSSTGDIHPNTSILNSVQGGGLPEQGSQGIRAAAVMSQPCGPLDAAANPNGQIPNFCAPGHSDGIPHNHASVADRARQPPFSILRVLDGAQPSYPQPASGVEPALPYAQPVHRGQSSRTHGSVEPPEESTGVVQGSTAQQRCVFGLAECADPPIDYSPCALKEHLERYHFELFNPVDGRYQCHWVGAGAERACKSSVRDLVMHIRRVHLKTDQVYCKYCGQGFCRPDSLKRHIQESCKVWKPAGMQGRAGCVKKGC